MPDLRKVLDGLEHCARLKPCDKCPYGAECKRAPEHNAVMAEALEMIREQNSKIIELKKERERLRGYAFELLNAPDRVKVVRCGDCRYWEPPAKDEVEDGCTYGRCHNNGARTDVDEFCSSGEKE